MTTILAAVLLELFTSQGCSSCPPADELLRALSRDAALEGKIIPLSFHVDYWNRIGWQDPFSSADWSRRQKEYAAAFRQGRVYTPQLVINGRAELVGSDERAIRREIARQIALSSKVHLWFDVARQSGGYTVTVRTEAPAELRDRLAIYAVTYENELVTKVGRGENGGRTLRNDFVVRAFREVAGGRATLPAGPADGIVVFAQDRKTRAIYAATRRTLR